MEENPITLTPAALTELSALEQDQNFTDAALRIWVAGGGCSGLQYGMALDDNVRDEDDTEFTCEKRRIYVDSVSLPYLNGIVVDYIEEDGAGGFKITNPNAVKSCGCGSSFQAEDGTGADTCGGCRHGS